MIRWLKTFLWPCKHSVKMLATGIITHKSLQVSSTHASNVYRLTIKCRRCQTVVIRFEGTIEERKHELIIIDEASGIPPDIWDRLENL